MARKCVDCDGVLLRGAAYCHRCGHPVELRPKTRRARPARAKSRTASRVAELDGEDDEFEDDLEQEAAARQRPRVKNSSRRRERSDRTDSERESPKRKRRSKKKKTPAVKRERVRASDDDPERELWSDTYSAKGLVNYWIVVALLSVALPIAAIAIHGEQVVWQFVVAAIGAAWATMLVWIIYLKLDVHYVLTNQRFLHKSGILTRHTRRIEVIDIDDLNIRQSIIERIINVGTIEVISSDRSDPVIELTGIDNVEEVAYVMDEARRAERLRRGLHIESV